MFATLQRTWSIIGESWEVLKRQKSLLLFPIFSGIACLLVIASFVAPFLLFPDWADRMLNAAYRHDAGTATQILWLVVVFLYYFINYFIMIFFNAALVACALVHFKGGQPTMGDGLAAAGRRLPQIFAWALVAATVGVILRAIEERAEKLGQFIIGLIGLVWTVASYLVVPVLVVEGVGPIDALKRSTSLLRRTWGEGLVGNFSLGLIGFLAALPGIALIVAGIALGKAFLVLVVVGVIYFIAVSLVLTTLKQIYLAALYLYAAEGQLAAGFTADDMRQAFRHK